MSHKAHIKVLLVDDHEMVRKGLRLLLMAFDDFRLVGETDSGAEAIRLCGELRPDVVIMDLVMPTMNGVAATQNILALYPEIKIIALTSFRDESMVKEAIQAGAIGYLMKDVSIDQLAEAIRHAYEGRPTVDSAALRALITAARQGPSPVEELTNREKTILALMIQGLTNPQIAEELTIGRSTVKTHVSNILAKLGVSSRLEAVTLALHSGWEL